MRPTQIHLDRLTKALAAQGFKASRARTLEIAAAAFGYHNSNEFTAAAKRGDLQPPQAEYVGSATLDGTAMVVLRDPTSQATYAIEETFVEQVVEEERAERFGVSPYGHLLDLSEVAAAEPKAMAAARREEAAPLSPGLVYTATISHNHGTNTYVDMTRTGLYRQLRAYCVEWWHEVEDGVEIDLDAAKDEDVVAAYFEENATEYLETDTAIPPSSIGTEGDEANDGTATTTTTDEDAGGRLVDGLTADSLSLVRKAAEEIGWNLSHHMPAPPLRLTLDEALALGALLRRVETAGMTQPGSSPG